MSRPELIARIHEVRYELNFTDKHSKSGLEAIYRKLLEQAAGEYRCSVQEIKASINDDFRKWYKEEGLPKPAQKKR